MELSDEKQPEKKKLSKSTKALIGGLCGMVTTAVVHPLDLVKVRMQVFPDARSTTQMAQRIVRCEGFTALYAGLTAGLLRQATYTTTRLGAYYWLYGEYRKRYGIIPPLSEKVLFGVYAGLAGAFAGNPSEVILIRMMADGKIDPCSLCKKERRYRSAFHAINKIISTEGLCALWRGGTLTLARSVFVSISQIVSYSQVLASEALKQRKLAVGTELHIYTSVISSFFTAVLTLPVDLIKTRYQFRRDGVSVTQPEVFEDILKNKGVLYFWKGFLPYFIRLSIHTAMTYLILDEINEYYVRYYQDEKKE